MKKYEATLTGHYEKTISVYADRPEDARRKMEIVLHFQQTVDTYANRASIGVK